MNIKIYIVIVAIIIILLFLWFIIENKIIVTTKHKIKLKLIPKSFDGFKILQIADLHKYNNYTKLIDKIKATSPDIIVFCGDMISRDCTNFSSLESFFTSICKIAPVYYALGNHELDLPDIQKAKLIQTIFRTDIILLDNRKKKIERNGEQITISGACLSQKCYRNDNGGFSGLQTFTSQMLSSQIGRKPKDFTILLAHNPLFFDEYAKYGAELVLSGHVHGGIIRLPFIGGLLSPERKFFPKYSSGLYYKNNTVMSVSRGIGKLRLFNPPEITIITLETADE